MYYGRAKTNGVIRPYKRSGIGSGNSGFRVRLMESQTAAAQRVSSEIMFSADSEDTLHVINFNNIAKYDERKFEKSFV